MKTKKKGSRKEETEEASEQDKLSSIPTIFLYLLWLENVWRNQINTCLILRRAAKPNKQHTGTRPCKSQEGWCQILKHMVTKQKKNNNNSRVFMFTFYLINRYVILKLMIFNFFFFAFNSYTIGFLSSMLVVPHLFHTRDWFGGRQFVHRSGVERVDFRMLQAPYMYSALYFSF